VSRHAALLLLFAAVGCDRNAAPVDASAPTDIPQDRPAAKSDAGDTDIVDAVVPAGAGVVTREALMTALSLALTLASVWLIVLGTRPQLEDVAWGAMLTFGLCGLLTIFYALRVRSAGRLTLVASRDIRRYLRLHDPSPL
jgi:hypothetical protein